MRAYIVIVERLRSHIKLTVGHKTDTVSQHLGEIVFGSSAQLPLSLGSYAYGWSSTKVSVSKTLSCLVMIIPSTTWHGKGFAVVQAALQGYSRQGLRLRAASKEA